MAKNPGMRPTPRQKSPLSSAAARAAAPSGGVARRTVSPAAAPKAPRPAKAKLSMPKLAKAKAPAPKARPAKAKPAKVKASKAAKALAPKASRRAASPAGSPRPALLDRAAAMARQTGSPSAASGRERRQRYQRGQVLRVVLMVAGGLVALALVGLVALFVLRDSAVFLIESVEAEPTEHVTQTDIQNLVHVPAGSTLLNVDTDAVEAALKKDPWVADVTFERVFPHTLRIEIVEQRVEALVVMNTGSVAWYLGDADIWIQPTKIEAAEGQSVNDAALAQALADGCLLITDVPATVSPAAGSVATDEVLDAVAAFRRGFSEEFLSQVVSFSAASPDSITCTLKNGVEILLGSPTDIAAKETVVTRTLEQHPGAVTYINVRVVTDPAVRPTVRLVDSDNVEAGDGVSASAPDEGQAASDATQGSADAQGSDDASQGEGSDGEGSQDASQGSDDGSADGGGDLEGSVDATAEGDA